MQKQTNQKDWTKALAPLVYVLGQAGIEPDPELVALLTGALRRVSSSTPKR